MRFELDLVGGVGREGCNEPHYFFFRPEMSFAPSRRTSRGEREWEYENQQIQSIVNIIFSTQLLLHTPQLLRMILHRCSTAPREILCFRVEIAEERLSWERSGELNVSGSGRAQKGRKHVRGCASVFFCRNPILHLESTTFRCDFLLVI